MFFDFGGTLFSYLAIGRELFAVTREAAERLGIHETPRELAAAWRAASRESYRSRAGDSYYLHKDLFLDNLARFAAGYGAEVTQELAEWYHESQRVRMLERFETRDDCRTTLEVLRARGDVHLGIVSNIDDDYLGPMLQKVGLTELFDSWTSSEEARSCKPHPAIYHLACEKAGVRPENVVFVGDSPEQDIAGARPLGMETVHILEGEGQAPGSEVGPAGEPHHTIRALAELPPIVEAWARGGR